MEPVTLIAAVSRYVLPKALEKIGEKLGESALSKSGKSIHALYKLVRSNLKSADMEGVLAKARTAPTEVNVTMLETILLDRVTTDPTFANKLQALVESIHSQFPELQAVFDSVRIKGNIEVGDVSQLSHSGVSQVIAHNLGAGGDFKVGDVTQEIR